MSELTSQIQTFREHVLEAGVLDSEGVHHEFSSDKHDHGRKLDFDRIPTYRNGSQFSPLYAEWVDVTTSFIAEEFPDVSEVVLLGVANGTNRLAIHTAPRLKICAIGLESIKEDQSGSTVLRLSRDVAYTIAARQAELVIVVEDVGTTGSNSLQVATRAQEAGAENVVVVNTWQRREQLERLDEAGIEYRAIIDEPLPTYSPEDCVKTGFCAQGWKFIPYKR